MDTTQGIAAEKAGWRMGVGGRYGVLAALAAAAVVVTLIVTARLGACNFQVLCGAVIDDDVAQGRLDIAPPPPRGAAVIEQSFVPNRHGLTQINLLLARYGELQPGDDSTFTLELWDGETRVAEQTLATVTLTHNQPVSFSFPAQRHSAGRRYVLRLSGSEANPVSVWAYSLDAYGGGELSAAGGTDGQSPLPAADLRFVTQYALTWGDALGAAVAPLRHDALRLLAAALLLPLGRGHLAGRGPGPGYRRLAAAVVVAVAARRALVGGGAVGCGGCWLAGEGRHKQTDRGQCPESSNDDGQD